MDDLKGFWPWLFGAAVGCAAAFSGSDVLVAIAWGVAALSGMLAWNS